MAKKKKNKKSLKERVDKVIKAKIREDRIKTNYYQRTTEKTHKSKKTYSRKNKRPPDVEYGDDEKN